MRRFTIAVTAGLLLLLGAQVALAQYGTSGPVQVSTSNPAPGDSMTVTGSGYAGGSQVRITIESDPVHLATVTADSSGLFSTVVSIPTGFSGRHDIVATGIDPAGSVRVLASSIVVGTIPLPDTSTDAPPVGAARSDGLIFTGAGIGILAVACLLLLVNQRLQRR